MSQNNGDQFFVDPDAPIETKSEDILNRQPFAVNLVDALRKFPEQSSLVLSLEGSWGSGKTSIYYLMKEYLDSLPHKIGEGKPLFLKFNPWWFSSKDDLVHRFFEQLGAEISVYEDSFKTLGKLFTSLGGILTPVAAVHPYAGIAAIGLRTIGNFVSTENLSLERIKRKIEAQLIEDDIKLWIFIDDIDRLLPDEALQMVSLIRGVGDIGNIKYILAFDRTELEKRIALALNNDKESTQYLDKVIQITFPVPNTVGWKIFQLLGNGVEQILGEEIIDQQLITDFQQLWEACWGKVLITPRHVKRLLNTFVLGFNAVRSELYSMDFLAIETMRMFFPQLYFELSHFKTLLCGDHDWKYVNQDDIRKADAQKLLNLVDEKERETARNLLLWLFPPLKGLFTNSNYNSHNNREKWRNERRISSANFFDAYFQLNLSPDTLSRLEEADLIDSAASIEGVESLFKSKSQEMVEGQNFSKSFLLLDAIHYHLDELLESDKLKNLLTGILNVADEIALNNYRRSGSLFSSDFMDLLGRFVRRIVRDYPEKIDVMSEIFQATNSIHGLVYIMRVFNKEAQNLDSDKLSHLKERDSRRETEASIR